MVKALIAEIGYAHFQLASEEDATALLRISLRAREVVSDANRGRGWTVLARPDPMLSKIEVGCVADEPAACGAENDPTKPSRVPEPPEGESPSMPGPIEEVPVTATALHNQPYAPGAPMSSDPPQYPAVIDPAEVPF